MKKMLALTLALALCLSLTACTFKVSVPSLDNKETTAATEPKTEAPATEAPSTEAPETEAPTEGEETVSIHGTVEGNTYTNKTLNVKFTVPDGWSFYTDEQIAEQNNQSAELFEGTDLAEAIKTAGQLVDMMAAKGDGSNANLVIQPAQAIMSTYTDKQIFELLEENYKAQFGSSGMEIKEYETVEMPALGEDRAALRMVIEMAGFQMTEYQIWLRDSEEYYGILTLTLLDEADAEPLVEGISSLN